MTVLFIPLEPEVPSQRFRAVLDGYDVAFRVRWQVQTARWYIDIDCEAVGLHTHGFDLVTGVDFFANRTQGALGVLMLADLQGLEDPDFEGLGIRWRLTYVTVDDVASL